MLFENRKQISAEALMLKYATRGDYENLVKRPSFEVSKNRRKIDRINGGAIKVPKSTGMRSHFMATDSTTKHKVEIRYAESNNTRIVGDRVIDSFEPRYVNTNGATFAYQHDLDLAVYMFLHPNNTLSPLASPASKNKGKYEYIDTKKRSQDKIATIDALTDALSHAKSLNEDRLVILAKGLGIKGIDKKEVSDVRADVMEFASKYPKVYNEKAGTEATYIEGRITNLIDKGVVKLATIGNVRRWSWASGELTGEHILDVVNVTQDAKQSLKNFFFSDINKWMNVLNDINNNMSAREKMNKALEEMESGKDVNASEPAYQQERTIGDALPAYLQSATPEGESIPKYTKEDAIRILTEEDEFGNPPHHMKVVAWLKKNNAE